ncbi:MAG: hypothetical protein JXB49_03715 [Bacteroidales bacterium]|nr:hypothetical protein [Bacteroidales bacterium]
MMKRIILILISTIHFLYIYSQGTVEYRPFQVTLFPPISSNGIHAANTVNYFSLNLFAGVASGVHGFEFGGFVNMERDFVKGMQYAGFGNINGGDIEAMQFSGFFNINKGSGVAIQGAGFVNINGGDIKGIEAAGFFNTSRNFEGIQAAGFGNIAGDVEGGQASGFFNISGNITGGQAAGFFNLAGDLSGGQGAGFYNQAKDITGGQVAGFVNIANDVEGGQAAGFINLAKNVKGFQIAGFLNICDSIDGVPIAVVNIVRKNGYRKIEISSDETFYFNTAFKMGVEKFYTFINLGMHLDEGNNYYSYGFGGGTNVILDPKKSLSIEYLSQQLFNDDMNKYAYEHSLHKIRILFNYHFAEKTCVFAGPSISLLTSRYSEYTNPIKPSWAFEITDRQYNRTDGWFGFSAGLRFL